MTPVEINCIFAQTADLGCTPAVLLAALDNYVKDHLGTAWNVACKLRQDRATQPGAWELIFADDADQAGALGYHDDDGTPRGHVFVATAAKNGEHPTTVASHELAELLCDPGANLGAFSPRGRWVALEVCDPVERTTFAVNGLPMSDFVYPCWFGQGGGDGRKWDHAGECRTPWHLLPGGYIPVWQNGQWSQLFGSLQAMEQFQTEDRRLRRNKRREAKGPRPG